MARQGRKLSESGYMHVIVRGIGRQLLFEEEEDYAYYLDALEKYSRDLKVTETQTGDGSMFDRSKDYYFC